MSGSGSDREWAGQRVLVLAPTPTHPQDYGNRKRIFRVCKRIADAGGQIYFAHYPAEAAWHKSVPWNADRLMRETWAGYFTIPSSRPFHSLPEKAHHDIDEWWDNNIGFFLQWLFQVESFDAFIVNYAWLSKALDHAPPTVLKVLDTHDKMSGRRELLAENGIAPEFFFTTEAQEARALDRADVVWAIKEQEQDFFSRLTKKPVLTLPHIDEFVPVAARNRAADDVFRVGFIGARNSVNRVGIEAFIREAVPIFRKWFAPIELVVAGSICDDLRRIESPFVKVVGRVQSVADFYGSLDCAVVPMMFSTGQKIKTGEALAAGLPVVATAHAFEGYQPAHAYHALPDLAAVANALVELAFDPDLLPPLRQASQVAHRESEAVIRKTLRRTRELLRNHQQSLVIAVDSRAFIAGSAFNAVLESSYGFLRDLGDVTVVVVAGSARDVLAGRSHLRHMHRVLVASDLADAEACRSRLEDGVEVVDVAEFLIEKGVNIILADAAHSALDRPMDRETVLFIRPEMIALSKGDAHFAMPGPHSGRRILVCNSVSAGFASLQAAAGCSIMRAPLLYDPRRAGIGFCGASRNTVIILGSPQSPAVAMALAWAEAWKMRVRLIGGVDPKPQLPSVRGIDFACSSAEEFSTALLRGDCEQPLFTLDFSAGGLGYQLCRELLDRTGAPVFSGAEGSPHYPTDAFVIETDAQLADIFREFALGLKSAQRAPRPAEPRYVKDEGWASIRTVLNDLEHSQGYAFA